MTEKMVCPDCGVEMNKHAEKINYAVSLEGAREAEADLGGVVEEAYACPACGKNLSRRGGDGGEA